jgi:FkbH-like protein
LWGGIVGDDGMQGLALGHGSAEGEAFLAFQHYLRRLRERGILLAVCSKNDEAVARAAVAEHPEMVLRPDDFAAFVANWEDKPSNLRRIAADLRLGLDALVFFDDNPMERDLVRQTLPEVAVPEAPEEPALYARCLVDAGYFEAMGFTDEDRQRAGSYAADVQRREAAESSTDLAGYLAGLEMRLQWRPFQEADLPRIAQLVNKTNQFNLTTRRYAEAELAALAREPQVVTFAGRLADKFGESGLVTVIIGRTVPHEGGSALDIDTWLMSCRVLGRTVEAAVLGQVAALARARGCRALLGRYIPTTRNQLVADLYERMGFTREGDGWRLYLDEAPPWPSPIAVEGMGA